MDAENTIDNIKDYTNRMFKIAQLISEDFFSHYQCVLTGNGLLNEKTMMEITQDLTANDTLFEIILDYLSKISDTARTASNTLRDVRQETQPGKRH